MEKKTVVVVAPGAAEKPAAPPQATVPKPEEPPPPPLASAALQGPTNDDVVPHKSENLDQYDHRMSAAPKGSMDRDIALAKIEDEKRTSFIKAWEDGEKSKIENKVQKNLAEVLSWENTKKASMEAKLKKMEEEIERKKAEYGEKMKNKIALVHKEAEEKKSLVLCKRGEELLQVEEMGAKFRASGQVPKKALLGCLG